MARSVPVQGRAPIRKVLYPINEFMHAEASGGIVLMACALAALVWANSPWADSYAALWGSKITIGPEGYAISETLLHWINDGLMAVFFFVVGLEMKREVLVGELASLRLAALPVAAALGAWSCPPLFMRRSTWAARARAVGACQWPRTSRSRSVCSRCWGAGRPRASRSFSPRSPS